MRRYSDFVDRPTLSIGVGDYFGDAFPLNVIKWGGRAPGLLTGAPNTKMRFIGPGDEISFDCVALTRRRSRIYEEQNSHSLEDQVGR